MLSPFGTDRIVAPRAPGHPPEVDRVRFLACLSRRDRIGRGPCPKRGRFSIGGQLPPASPVFAALKPRGRQRNET